MILVVGATGALGGMVTRELLSRGAPVRVLVRPGSEYTSLVERGAQPVMGDVKDAGSLARACAGVKTVVTTANSSARGGTDTTDSVDRHGNRSLIDEAVAAGVDHFVFVSALGSREDHAEDFFRAKAETESYLKQSGMAWTIVQPDLFMDIWIGMLIGVPLRQGMPVTLVGGGDHRHSMIAMRDVAMFVAASVTNPAALNRTLAIGGPDAVTWTEVAAIAGDVRGRPLDVRYVAPGEALPGLPPIASQLGASFETYETVIDTTGLAADYGIRLTTVEEFLHGMLTSVDA